MSSETPFAWSVQFLLALAGDRDRDPIRAGDIVIIRSRQYSMS